MRFFGVVWSNYLLSYSIEIDSKKIFKKYHLTGDVGYRNYSFTDETVLECEQYVEFPKSSFIRDFKS